MSKGYVTVNWNRRKWIYDLCLWAGMACYLVAFVLVSRSLYQSDESLPLLTILLRATSSCAFVMLTLILCVGPLARMDHRYLPLLYNRRHFGVSMFFMALLHALLAVYWHHSFGTVNPFVSVFLSGGDYASITNIPFQALGAIALMLLFFLAATSHDYWNSILGGVWWKAIHMSIYPAYALVVLHVVFGAMQQDVTGFTPWMVGLSVGLVGGLHLLAAFVHSGASRTVTKSEEPWVPVGRYRDIPNDRAITLDLGKDERIAIFRYNDNHLCAVSNVCPHQNGPLGEGRVINGLITCPWHGYQYRPQDGCSPPPFTEKVRTYRLKLEDDQLFIDASPLPAGAPRPVLEIPETGQLANHGGTST